MHELQLVTVSDDGGHLVLTGPGRDQFRLVIDDRLRAAVRGDRSRLGQLQIQMESIVRPREIQARIRAGETAEDIAAEAGVPVDQVRRFEGPILAERAWMAEQARAVVPHRGEGRTASLDTLVTDRLTSHSLGADTVAWDSRRADDGTWVVAVSFASGKATRRATWRFDPTRRSIVPQDEDALWLTDGEDALAVATGRRLTAVGPRGERVRAPESAARTGGRTSGRGQGVGEVYDVEVDGGLEPVTAEAALPEAGLPGAHRPGAPRPGATTPSSAGLPSDDAEGDRTRSPATGSDTRDGSPATITPPAAATARGRSRGRRASVPSWDDILLGTRRPN